MLKKSDLLREQCFVRGKWVGASSKKTLSVKNPYNGDLLGSVPNGGKEDASQAIEAAYSAWDSWKKTSAEQRSQILKKWSELIDENKEDLAVLMTLEQGKPLTESRSEMEYANSFIKWFSAEALRTYGDIIPSSRAHQHLLVIKQPIGVVGAITPWNFPAAMITRKCAPAFAAGCTVVLKPASETPFSALALAYLADQAGFPAGVFNVITGDPKEIGLVLTTSPLIRKISFTGSTQIGKLLMEQSASTIKKISLELGGNAPFIVFDDANLEDAIQGAVACKFRNTGQTCVCANRFLIQDSVYDYFTEQLIKKIATLKLGNGLDSDTQIGPLINEKAIEKVEQHIADAVSKGASIAYGGKKASVGHLFFEPTVLTNMTPNMLLAQEETFGPVAALFKFKNEEEAISLANDTPFGLGSYFYSENSKRIWRIAEALESGMVGINTGIISNVVAPFGGIKESGIGREGSKYGIDEYLELKYLCVN